MGDQNSYDKCGVVIKAVTFAVTKKTASFNKAKENV